METTETLFVRYKGHHLKSIWDKTFGPNVLFRTDFRMVTLTVVDDMLTVRFAITATTISMAREVRTEYYRAPAFDGEEIGIVYLFILSRTKWKCCHRKEGGTELARQ